MCNIRNELEFSLFRLLTRLTVKCEECSVQVIMYENMACLQGVLLNAICKSKLKNSWLDVESLLSLLTCSVVFDLFVLAKAFVAVIGCNR